MGLSVLKVFWRVPSCHPVNPDAGGVWAREEKRARHDGCQNWYEWALGLERPLWEDARQELGVRQYHL